MMADENMNLRVGMAVADKLESDEAKAERAADALKAGAEIVGGHRGMPEQSWDENKVRVRAWQEEGEGYVRKNPMKAVFTALGFGFVLGFIFRH